MMAPIPATEPLTAAPTYVLISWVVVLAWLLIDLDIKGRYKVGLKLAEGRDKEGMQLVFYGQLF